MKKITKAVFPVAGMGSRFLPATGNTALVIFFISTLLQFWSADVPVGFNAGETPALQ